MMKFYPCVVTGYYIECVFMKIAAPKAHKLYSNRPKMSTLNQLLVRFHSTNCLDCHDYAVSSDGILRIRVHCANVTCKLNNEMKCYYVYVLS